LLVTSIWPNCQRLDEFNHYIGYAAQSQAFKVTFKTYFERFIVTFAKCLDKMAFNRL